MQIEQLYKIFLKHPVVTTDSRDCPEGSIFFALKGESFNGNRFAATALEKGCAYVVVDEENYLIEGDDRYIFVDDALLALQALAHEHRKHFSGPVIEITGTNGKTTTKELVSVVLSQKYNVLYTQGNFNNHIGVPKTLLRLDGQHEIAVIETGANHPGEIQTLAEIVSPDCGIITNVGIAHIEGFGSFEGVVKTKGELYDNLRNNPDSLIFLHADNKHLCALANGLRRVTYGSAGKGYDVEGEVVECAPFLKFRWRTGNVTKPSEWHEVQTNIVGSYNLDNALAAICIGLHFGVSESQASDAVATYQPTNNRSEMRQTASNTLIIDAYNANPSSMKAAIDNFALVTPPEGRTKMLILGDMKELGTISAQEHKEVINRLKTHKFEDVILVGDNFKKQAPPYPVFSDVEQLKQHLATSPICNRLILIKGSNSTKLYQLPEIL